MGCDGKGKRFKTDGRGRIRWLNEALTVPCGGRRSQMLGKWEASQTDFRYVKRAAKKAMFGQCGPSPGLFIGFGSQRQQALKGHDFKPCPSKGPKKMNDPDSDLRPSCSFLSCGIGFSDFLPALLRGPKACTTRTGGYTNCGIASADDRLAFPTCSAAAEVDRAFILPKSVPGSHRTGGSTRGSLRQ